MLEHLKREANISYTDNGAKVYKTAGSGLMDFFFHGGALRGRNENEIIKLFLNAFSEDELAALKLLFYFRDIRGGQGERRTFRTILKYLAKHYPSYVYVNMHLIPEYGRWDDLYELVSTPLEKRMFAFMERQFIEDLINVKRGGNVSLLGKWLKSENASSKNTKLLAKKTREYFNLTPRQYRKDLKVLRDKIKVVESLMSHNLWGLIEYDKVPAKAFMKYRNAFSARDYERFQAYIDSLKKGNVKINSKTLYPYEIIEKVAPWSYVGKLSPEEVTLLDEMWKALPDYIEDKNSNAIVVADVSGSMYINHGRPLSTAVSLAIYTAERLKGPYHNHFITFSNRPSLVEIKGKNILEKALSVSEATWGMDTNIEAVFDLILNTALKYNVTKDEMIERIFIISDMEFDDARSGNSNDTLFETIKKKYNDSGYDLPQLVFWNVNSMNTHVPMTVKENVLLVSGSSPSIFKSVLKGDIITAETLLLDVLNDERYSPIKLPSVT